MNLSELSVGDQVLISKPAFDSCRAAIVGRWASVTAIRALSFDADGLCFRKDGSEWCGCHRVQMFLPRDRSKSIDAILGAGASDAVH